MNKEQQKKYYDGFSLVEMLITMAIMMIVMLIVFVTFNTMVTTSIRSDLKLKARDEADMGLELLRKFLRHAEAEEIFVYNSATVRKFDQSAVEVVNAAPPQTVTSTYNTPLEEGQPGNEIHMRPSGSDRWICFGRFVDSEGKGYFMKSSGVLDSDEDGIYEHEDCFNNNLSDYKKNTIIINSDDVDFKNFTVRYYRSISENSMVLAELESIPSRWFGKSTPTSTIKQVVVSTGKLRAL